MLEMGLAPAPEMAAVAAEVRRRWEVRPPDRARQELALPHMARRTRGNP
jgi:hypothetical protein